MKILWLAWKDHTHPLAGGAELVKHELAKRLATDGHEVITLVGGYKGAEITLDVDGYQIVRVGNRFSVYWKAFRQYRTHLRDWPDMVIDEMNTIPFFAKLYVKQPNVMFIHQLARQIWFHEMRMPLSLIGYVLEPLYLRLLSDRRVVTISESTKKDLMRYGFKDEKIHIISEGYTLKPVKDPAKLKKFDSPTLLSFGAVRSMKQTLHQVQAFEIAKKSIPDLRLKIAGSMKGRYADVLRDYVEKSPFKSDIEILGRISDEEKALLMQKSHWFLATSTKEGWCLVVTEAASQGTPALVYDVDGLRDSVQDGITGFITAPRANALADRICKVFESKNQKSYAHIQQQAHRFSKNITFERSYEDMQSVTRSIF